MQAKPNFKTHEGQKQGKRKNAWNVLPRHSFFTHFFRAVLFRQNVKKTHQSLECWYWMQRLTKTKTKTEQTVVRDYFLIQQFECCIFIVTNISQQQSQQNMLVKQKESIVVDDTEVLIESIILLRWPTRSWILFSDTSQSFLVKDSSIITEESVLLVGRDTDVIELAVVLHICVVSIVSSFTRKGFLSRSSNNIFSSISHNVCQREFTSSSFSLSVVSSRIPSLNRSPALTWRWDWIVPLKTN